MMKPKNRAKAAEAVDNDQPDSEGLTGPSPNPLTNLVLASVALRGGGALVRSGIERTLLGTHYSPKKAKNILKGKSLTQTLLGTAVARVATASVPGAIIVGGGLLAKVLYDRHKGKAARTGDEKDTARIITKDEAGEP